MLPPFIVYRGCYRIVVLPPVGRRWTNPWAVTTRNAGTIHLFCCILSLSLSSNRFICSINSSTLFIVIFVLNNYWAHFFHGQKDELPTFCHCAFEKKKILITLLGLALFTVAYLTEVRAQRPNYAR